MTATLDIPNHWFQRNFNAHVLNGKQTRRFQSSNYMDVSKNIGKSPKWMVKIIENPIKIDDLGVPLFLETPI